jgi:hypothetical protein
MQRLAAAFRTGWISSGPSGGVGLVSFADADGIDHDVMILALASGVTALRSSSLMTRTPRPFICSKKLRDLTERMKSTTSSGLISVPVAIMSTVTAVRGKSCKY